MSGSDLGDRSSVFTAESVPAEYARHLAPVLFQPWAEVLLDAVEVTPGSTVLDVASGTGVVAREAARRCGTEGHVVASDISEPMLAAASALDGPDGAAPIEHREASADALPFGDGSFDATLCQQGLQFFPQQAAAVDEMRRVLRPGGRAGISVWASGHRLEPFAAYAEALVEIGAEPPFPGAFEPESYMMAPDAVHTLLDRAGFSRIDLAVVELEVIWRNDASAAAGALGTPFAPLINALSADRRSRLQTALLARFAPERPGGPVRRQTAAVIATATR
jgi:ubiquinone/menaquinone biosynthesis C-methylase UbiE